VANSDKEKSQLTQTTIAESSNPALTPTDRPPPIKCERKSPPV
jgi:hypothetical protein